MNMITLTRRRRRLNWRHLGTAGFVFFFAKGILWVLAAALIAALR